MSSLYYCVLIRRSGKESNPTQLMVIVVKCSSLWVVQLPSQNNLSNDIQTHGASTISDPVMPVRNEWFASPFSFSTYIISKLATKVKFFLHFIIFLLCFFLFSTFTGFEGASATATLGGEGERWCPVLRSALGLTIMWAHRHVSPLTPSLFCFI